LLCDFIAQVLARNFWRAIFGAQFLARNLGKARFTVPANFVYT
jgi:hypothetical protein